MLDKNDIRSGDPYADLAAAIIKQAVDDWYRILKRGEVDNEKPKIKTAEIRRFLNGEWCLMLCNGVDPTRIIKKLEIDRLNYIFNKKEVKSMNGLSDIATDLLIANAQINQLKRQLAESQRREKAAIKDLEMIFDCETCGHFECCQYEHGGIKEPLGANYNCYEWRGPQEPIDAGTIGGEIVQHALRSLEAGEGERDDG